MTSQGDDASAGDSGASPDGGAETPLGAPVTLASAQGGPRGIAVNATDVFWVTESGDVARVAKSGGAVQVLATQQLSPLDLAVDGTSVYWFNLRGRRTTVVYSIPIAGGAPRSMGDIDGITYGRMTADATTLWFTKDARLIRVVKTGGVSEVPGVSTGALTTDGATVFVAKDHNVVASPGGTTPVLFATGGAVPVDITVDEEAVYWLSANGDLTRAAKTNSGGPGTVLASNLAGATRLTTFGDHVYVTAAGAGGSAGRILRVAKAGGAPDILVRDLAAPYGIAVDPTGIYWTEQGAGLVRSRPR